MRNRMLLALVAAASFLSACTSYVRTFDENDKQLGACVSYKGLFGPKVDCGGSANPQTQGTRK